MKWQPIETAPRESINSAPRFLGWDGTWIEVCWEGWQEDDGTPVWVHSDYIRFQPTHWMPLPEPPKEKR